MKAYRVTLVIIDHDELGADEITSVIENQRYPNHCMNPKVTVVQEADIGPWRDDHPLNYKDADTAPWFDGRAQSGCTCKQLASWNGHEQGCPLWEMTF